MGAICPKGVSSSVSIVVNAPRDIVLSTISDIQAYPKIHECCKSVSINTKNTESISSNVTTNVGNDHTFYEYKEGLSWNEIRIYNGKEHNVHKCITSIQTKTVNIYDNKALKCNQTHEQTHIHIHVSHPSSFIKKFFTRTLIIDSILLYPESNNLNNLTTKNKNINSCCCTLTGTAAVIPHTLLFQIYMIIFGGCLMKSQQKTNKLFGIYISEIAIEAEIRYKSILQQIENNCSN